LRIPDEVMEKVKEEDVYARKDKAIGGAARYCFVIIFIILIILIIVIVIVIVSLNISIIIVIIILRSHSFLPALSFARLLSRLSFQRLSKSPILVFFRHPLRTLS
jgi:uncharacterized membrane protein